MNYFKKVLIALVLIFNINLNVQSQVLAKALKDEFTITVAQDGSGDYTCLLYTSDAADE